MKQTTPDGKMWVQIEEDGSAFIGLTKEYLDRIGTVWSFIPRSGRIEKGKRMASLETAKCLVPIHSPVDGEIVEVNPLFYKMPEKFNDDYFAKVKL